MEISKVVITGVTGFFGQALAKELLSEGIIVYGVGRDFSKIGHLTKNTNFCPISAELKEYKKLSLLIDDNVDVMFHFAWAGGFTDNIKKYELQMKNAIYAGDAIMAAIEMKALKFVYAGTYNQFEIANMLKEEYFEPRYTCIYSGGKTAGNIICKTIAHNNNIDYNSGLVVMPYGENNYSMQLVNVVMKQLLNGDSPKLIEGKNLYDMIYIDDVAKAFRAIAESGKNGKDYYVGHRKLKTFREIMMEIRDNIAPDVNLKFGEYKDNQQIDYSMIDLEALYRDTGFCCQADFADTIKKTAEWVENNIL